MECEVDDGQVYCYVSQLRENKKGSGKVAKGRSSGTHIETASSGRSKSTVVC